MSSERIQLVIPMAGRGQRFSDAGYSELKPLINIHGFPMISIVLANLYNELIGDVILITQRETMETGLLQELVKTYPVPVHVISVDEVTDGPADSVPGWLQDPGSRDITSHVDLTSVQRLAEALGCETLGLLDQTYFLMALAGVALGGADQPGGLALPSDPRSLRAFKTLMMPGGLGSTMKVMVFGRNVGRPLLLGLRGPARLT